MESAGSTKCLYKLFLTEDTILSSTRLLPQSRELTEDDIEAAVYRMAADIEAFSRGRPITLLGVLKGGIYLQYRLLYYIQNDIRLGHVGLSSYNGTSQKDLTVTYPVDLDSQTLLESEIWIIDDIADSGRTLEKTISMLTEKLGGGQDRIHSAVLVQKEHKCPPHLVTISGFRMIDDCFLVGYGMGLNEKYRSLRCLYRLG